jgi:hypothetical protein
MSIEKGDRRAKRGETVVQASRWLQRHRWRLRRLLLTDIGATRHILLIGLVGLWLALMFHWTGHVDCLLHGVGYGLRSPHGVERITC